LWIAKERATLNPGELPGPPEDLLSSNLATAELQSTAEEAIDLEAAGPC
jgi:hypothetical protein